MPRAFFPGRCLDGDCAFCLNRAPWPPGALTLALSRRAGEGTVVVGGGGLFEPRIGVIALMGCDAPCRFVPMVVCIGDCGCCLNRGLRRFSQMGYDAPRRFVPVVVCIGDCACCLNRGLR